MPAATIVAAWISAEAGVGPSMASGSQSWNGSWADLPATPQRRQSSAAVRSVVDGAAASDSAPGGTAAVQWPMTAGMAVVRAPAARMMIPITNAEVGGAGHEERLDGGPARGLTPAVVADQEERAPPHDLPPDQGEDQVAGLDDQQHRREEERDGGGEHGDAGVAPQVPPGERLDREPDHGDRDRDDRRQGVGEQVQRHRQPAERQGRHGRHRLGRTQPLDRRQLADRDEQREERPERGEGRGQPLAAGGRERQHGGDGGHQDDEPGAQLHEVAHAPGSVRSMLPRLR